uniref:Coagulation factor II (thrombin) receptor-like 1, tandem duplicate 2 n=1 Tax=Paramormyrops kingsleyae TaxID=1676925 RepID=A0A3B3THY6_9TELE|nr:proteinase-activated receptor 2-like [Paramormyrops kingsleyae]
MVKQKLTVSRILALLQKAMQNKVLKMSPARTIQLLISLYCIFTANAQTDSQKQKARGFVAFANPENGGRVEVGSVTAETLKSGLTTVFLPVVYIIVLAVGLPVNAMTIWVFVFRTKKKHPAAIYMANLALSDVLFVIWLPLKISYHFKGNNWVYGEELCKVLVGFFYGNMYCSILFIACLSVQRYWAVAYPLSQLKKDNHVACVISLAIWFVVCCSTTPLYLYDQTVSFQSLDITTCHDVNVIRDVQNPFQDIKYPYVYFILMFGLMFLVPSLVIILAYICLIRKLGDSMYDTDIGRKRRKAVILILIVMVTFVVCFVPSNIVLIIHYTLLKYGVADNGYKLYITVLCLASLNSCLDPFIYYYVSEDFRDSVRNTLLCRSHRQVERLKVSFNSMKYSKKSNVYSPDNSHTQTSD